MPKTGLRIAVVLVLALTMAATDGRAEDAVASNVLYVESNNPNAGQNSVLAYHRNSNGSLTMIGEFLTGGTGTGNPDFLLGPDDIDKELVVSPDHRLLFAVNSGSNTIAMFRIHSDGSLEPVPGSPFPSGGIQPVSLALQDGHLYVANKNQDPAQPNTKDPNYTAFRVIRVPGEERLRPIPRSTIRDDLGSSPASLQSSPVDENQVFAVTFGVDIPNPTRPSTSFDSRLHSFRIGPRGRLTESENTPQTIPAGFSPPLMLGLLAHPTERILYVGFVAAGFVGVYTYDDDGELTFVRAVGNSGRLVCWFAIDPDRKYFYTSDNGNDSISTYKIEPDATLGSHPQNPVEVQIVALNEPDATGPGAPFELSVDPSGQFLYVVGERRKNPDLTVTGANVVHILQIDKATGLLTEASFSPMPLPIPDVAHPHGMVVF
jgi:6-phosphogluconolactonase (cycloisomerase 2 family)